MHLINNPKRRHNDFIARNLAAMIFVRSLKMKKDTVLVVGASGTVGSEVVRLLKAEGLNVRTTTSKQPQDASAVHVNLVTGEGIRNAFEGVDKAFFLSPPGYTNQYAILSPLIQESKRRGLKKVVLMTAVGVNASDELPFRRAEIELEKSGLRYNIIRPNWFMQNFNTFWQHDIRTNGQIQLPAGHGKSAFIDAKDISAVAAKLLTTDRFDNKAFDLSGPESLSYEQAAQELSKATGRQIVYKDIEPAQLKKTLVTAGLPSDYADLLVLLFSFVREGYHAAASGSVKEILGREPRSLREYAQAMKGELS